MINDPELGLTALHTARTLIIETPREENIEEIKV